MKIDVTTVRRRAEGRWEEIYARLAPELEAAVRVKGRHVPCPVHGGKDGFRLHRTATNGLGVCNTCREFAGKYLDGFAVLMWLRGWRFPQMLEAVASIVAPEVLREGQTAYAPPVSRVEPRVKAKTNEDLQKDLDAVAKMRRVWDGGVPVWHPSAALAWRYLESRGLQQPTRDDGIDGALRFIPELEWWDSETGECDVFPAIVARVQSREGMTLALHRTYLSKDGRGKAPVPEPKKMMSRPSSVSIHTGAIRLGPAIKGVLAVAEGLETALAVHAFTGYTCWSVVSSSLMRSFLPPEGVRGVAIFADNDVSGGGQEAASALQEALKAKGIQTRLDLPVGPVPSGAKSVDWLDVYNQFGKDAINHVPSFARARQSNVVQFKPRQAG
ncbi:DUF7146 domain-containing protein [Metallibacterium scheffleri]|uniref:DNA primase/helicase Gp4 N-terminal Bacteriophage T7-like domain-containing protein n=1 Tax=Metallibacterium scheffleri TaxID=993689 RepID=A0A4S3KRS1_9GAMM|nr:toprim domain-containing protein [Metallibacterium scheffleri]THD11656.1 hypothetical protein B1806_02670 [Metallibacterium scheffleri]